MTISAVVKEAGTYIAVGAAIGSAFGGALGVVASPAACIFASGVSFFGGSYAQGDRSRAATDAAIDHFASCLTEVPFTGAIVGAVVGGSMGASVYVIKEVVKRCMPPVVNAVAGLLGYRITRMEQRVN